MDPADAGFMDKQVSAEVLTRADGVMLVLFSTRWRLEGFQRDTPDVKLGRWWRQEDRTPTRCGESRHRRRAKAERVLVAPCSHAQSVHTSAAARAWLSTSIFTLR